MTVDGETCARCDRPAARKQGHQHLCPMHYRFGQMRALAKRRGLAVPTHDQLHSLVSWLKEMTCPHCQRRMNWLAGEGQSTVVTLQHYRSGSMGLICRACNTRHGAMEGDSFCDLPPDSKRCPGCKQVKPLGDFATDRTGRWKNRKTYCRPCSADRYSKWAKGNREAYNRKQREYRARRKAAGNPVPGGSRG